MQTPSSLSRSLSFPLLVITLGFSAWTPSLTAGTTTKPLPPAKPTAAPLAASTSSDPDLETQPLILDPLEPLNRGLFAINHQLYRFVLRPLAKATETILPKPVLRAVGNAFDNLETPVRVAGSLLQGNVRRASKETSKLLVNSTLGIGGLFKASDQFACLKDVPAEDTGLAFASWGVPHGPYLVLPILGPSSTRDLSGKIGDTLLNPVSWLSHDTLRYALTGGRAFQQNPKRMRTYDEAVRGTIDPYVAVRDGYLTYRNEAANR